MSDRDERSMSIVPYASSRDVVLRHNDAVVVFDRASKQLVLQSADNAPTNIEPPECPYCHQRLRDGNHTNRERGHTPAAQHGFVNPEYFRMLDATLPGTSERSGPPSPRRRLVQPIPLEGSPLGSSYSDDTTAPASPGISSTAFSQGYFKRFFVEEGVLGRGGKGVVLLVKHVLDGVPLGQFACKRVPVGDDHEWLKKVLIEVQLLQGLSHQNLVPYRHVWLENAKLSNFGPSVPCAFILQQYCNAGDLQKYVCGSVQSAVTPQQLKERLRRRSKGEPEVPSFGGPVKLQFEEIYSFFRDITSGLKYLHENGYIHRDLKPSNCLLHETGRELRVLVSDFGEVQSENTIRNSTGSTGTISYCAPEVLRRLSPNGPFGNFTFKSDVFSLGMILYFLCFAELPYRNADVIDEDKEDLDELRTEISQWAGFDDARRLRPELPEKLYSFLKRMLSVDPNERPTAADVLSGIQTGVGASDSHRYHRNGRSAERRSKSLALPVESPNPASEMRSPSNGLGTGITPSRHAHGYGTNKTIDIRRTSEPIPEMGEEIRPSENTLLIHSPTDADHSILHPGHQRIPAANHLLMPPPRRFSFYSLIRHRINGHYVAITLAFLKILSITRPCSPLAVNTWIFYPLLLLTISDLGTTRTWIHVSTLVIHLIVTAFALRLDFFCLRASKFQHFPLNL
ncbi:putative serine/threonine-protein kinase iks1 [Coccidioides posadasii str. Silveira]|uniref:non-specific serine/threonine protein kinase n=1 Tax=Coccidioides posadasii (strain RMSCC 757 / Silveira) TaxID=443226 RepID=E9DEP1_COCPS|nr:protein kinase [Coccidioides posadasii str. Silveira]QVM09888.1 putative serine/threonine-protein kinase iks1 [Coccidioides posadasii str. Silveira]